MMQLTGLRGRAGSKNNLLDSNYFPARPPRPALRVQVSRGGNNGGEVSWSAIFRYVEKQINIDGDRRRKKRPRLRSFLTSLVNNNKNNNEQNSAHWPDYLVVLLLFALAAATEHAPPFLKSISGVNLGSEEEMYKYRYPFIGSKEQRVPAAALPLIALAFPSLVIVAHAALAGTALFGGSHPPPSRLEAHAALLGLFASVTSTGAATNLLKIGVGRPRPNFAARCWPDSQPQFDDLGVPICAANAVGPLEARKSWPSGHASISSSGLCYLTFWAAGKLRVFSPELAGHPSRLVVASLPMCLAIFVAVSRVSDFYHHATDVVCGFALGTILAYCHFRQCFRCFTSARAGESHAAAILLGAVEGGAGEPGSIGGDGGGGGSSSGGGGGGNGGGSNFGNSASATAAALSGGGEGAV